MHLEARNLVRTLAVLLMLAGMVALAACSADSRFLVPDEEVQANFDEVYRLGPGDVVRVNVFGEDDLTGDFKVDGSQTIPLPLAGEIRVGGLTLRAAEEKVAEGLKDGYLVDPRVSMEVVSYRPFYILGEVGQPGSYPYQEGMNVLNAVAIAGGFTYRAENERVEILRPQEATPEVVAAEVHDFVLPGDIIYVKERIF